MAEIRIIAGPNGSGKTTFTDILSNEQSVLFNFNLVTSKETRNIPNKYEQVKETVHSHLKNTLDFAFSNKANLTIVTNLNDDQINTIDQILNEAKKEGYKTSLIYLNLNTLEDSMLRVKYREAEGGHEVLPETVESNFNQSKENFKQSSKKYDSVYIMDNSVARNIPILAVEIHNNVVKTKNLDSISENSVSDLISGYNNPSRQMKY